MEYAIMGIAFGLCLFLLPILAYERGVRMGMRMSKGIEPAPVRSPTEIIEQRKEAKEAKIQDDKIAEGMANIFSYDGKPVK